MTGLSSPTLTNLLPALVAAQAAFGPATKDARNSHFGSSYTTLAAALDAILPALNAAGLCIVQQTHVAEGVVMLRTLLLHTSGEWIAAEYPILPTKPDPQGYGSATTYARRYCLMALVSVAPEDDDGNGASEPPAPKHRGTFPRNEKSRSKPRGPDVHADALAADLADAIDSAPDLRRLDELVETLQRLPAELRPPLRQRFSDQRTRLRELERDALDLAALDHPTEDTP
ncbi:hypothetical protein ABIE51_001724 [Lysobacter sp. OAE881]|uniref:ERF family protein n=1 Tax=Lysobacter sp. OAE881 TaxID=2663813 RepID=UPI001789DFC7